MKTLSQPGLTWYQSTTSPKAPIASPETSTTTTLQEEIIYPESDGEPMADNTKQFLAITTIQGNLASLFADDPFVLVVGDLFWYPVQGNDKIKRAPDVMVVFGVLKGHRPSYLQWKENKVVPQVVFEIRSPGNTNQEMAQKFTFYETYGVEEYYVYDPDTGDLAGWQRQGVNLRQIIPIRGWVSPWLGIRFETEESDLVLYHPDGRRFLSFTETEEARQRAEQNYQTEAQARTAEAQARAETEQRLQAEAQARAEVEQRLHAEAQARVEAEQRLHAEAEARTATEARLREVEAKLKGLGLL